mmetsp:Transcript_26854/g.39486  ORF Transcript_26854/g.39486 Transcript_26854/m.39486 type:complete len:80 (+) Transcript_26854:1819-2058(+)
MLQNLPSHCYRCFSTMHIKQSAKHLMGVFTFNKNEGVCYKSHLNLQVHEISDSVLSKTAISLKKEKRKREISNESARGP